MVLSADRGPSTVTDGPKGLASTARVSFLSSKQSVTWKMFDLEEVEQCGKLSGFQYLDRFAGVTSRGPRDQG